MSSPERARTQRRRDQRQTTQRRARKSNASRAVWIAAGGFIALIIGIGIALSGGGRDQFELIAYQGEDQLGGPRVTFEQVLAQGRPVVLNFWGGSCPPCRAEMPGMERVYEQLGGQYLMVGLDVGPFFNLGTRASAMALLRELGITYPAAYATSVDAMRAFGVNGLPATFFIASDGRIVDRSLGFVSEGEFRAKVARLISLSTTAADGQLAAGVR